eukprot:scaffold108879_cov57-Phaeocystis_antarctica.AAC.1
MEAVGDGPLGDFHHGDFVQDIAHGRARHRAHVRLALLVVSGTASSTSSTLTYYSFTYLLVATTVGHPLGIRACLQPRLIRGRGGGKGRVEIG